MGRAPLDRLGTGPSTGSGPARRPRERHGRLSVGLRRPAVPARPSSSPFPSRLRPGRLAAGLVAAALALLLAAGGAGAHDGTAGHVHLTDTGIGCDLADCPDAPTGFAAPGPKNGEITLHWSPASTGAAATSWNVTIAKSTVGTFIGTTLNDAGARSHTYKNLDVTETYNFLMRGLTGTGANERAGDFAEAYGVRPLNDTQAPAVTGAAVNGASLTVTFDEALDTGSTPAGTAFTVTETRAGASRIIRGTGTAFISGTTARVSLARAVAYGWTVTVQYVKPGANPLQDFTGGNDVATFTGRTAVNEALPPQPQRAGALVDVMDGCTEAACPDAPTGYAEPGPGRGQITVKWQPATTGGIVAEWQLKTSTGGVTDLHYPALSDRSRTFSNLDPTKVYNIVVQGVGAGRTFGDAAVARNIRPADTPVFSSAAVNGTALTVTFDKALDTGSRPAGSAFTVTATQGGTARTLAGTGTVRIAGAAVTVTLAGAVAAGETVTLAYAAPASNPLRNAAGYAVQNFTGQAVTNNTPAPGSPPTAPGVDPVPLKLGLDRGCANCPHAPTGTAEPGPGYGEITLRWEPATTGPQGATEAWIIYADKQTTGNVRRQRARITNGQARSHTLTGLETGVTWTVGVERRRRDGINRVWSGDSAQARLQPLSITVDAGDDVTVRSGARVALDGTGSRGVGTPTYAWTQTAGPTVALDDATSATPAFVAPSVSASTDLTFSLTVSEGTHSGTDTVTVTVLPSRVVSARVDGDELKVTFDAALDATSRPAGSAFTVTAVKPGSNRAIAGTAALVTISGSTVTAALSAAAAGDETLTVSYDKPDSGAVLQDSGGAALESFANRRAVNAGDTTAPAFVSASINGTVLTVVFDEALDESVPQHGPLAPFGIQTTTGAGGQSYSISGNTVTVIFSAPGGASHGETVTVDYFSPSPPANRFKDLSGNELASFSGKPATNVTPPAFSSASVDGDTLTVTFDGGLDESSVPAASAFTVKATRSGTERAVALADTTPVSISGSAVTLTLAEAVLPTPVDTVTVAYAAPDTNPLQDADNAKHPVPDFAAQAVMNDTPADTVAPTLVSAAGERDGADADLRRGAGRELGAATPPHRLFSGLRRHAQRGGHEHRGRHGHGHLASRRRCEARPDFQDWLRQARDPPAPGPLWQSGGVHPFAPPVQRHQRDASGVLVCVGGRGGADGDLRRGPGRGLGAGGVGVHGEGDALGDGADGGAGGRGPGLGERDGGDADAGRGGAAHPRGHGDGGLRGAGHRGDPLQDADKREAPGAGLRRPGGDERHPGGHGGADAGFGAGERDGADADLRRGAGRELGAATPPHRLFSGLRRHAQRGGHEHRGRHGHGHLASRRRCEARPDFQDWLRQARDPPAPGPLWQSGGVHPFAPPVQRHQRDASGVLVCVGGRGGADGDLRRGPGRGLGAGGVGVHGEGDALGDGADGGAGGRGPGLGERDGGDADAGRGGAAHPRGHGDGGLRGAGHRGDPLQDADKREAPGAGLRRPGGDERHPGGHGGADAGFGAGERCGADA